MHTVLIWVASEDAEVVEEKRTKGAVKTMAQKATRSRLPVVASSPYWLTHDPIRVAATSVDSGARKSTSA
eukprot:1835323-Amphidinium_carterae.2